MSSSALLHDSFIHANNVQLFPRGNAITAVVQLDVVGGKYCYRPINYAAKAIASIAGTVTITEEAIAAAKTLGIKFEVKPIPVPKI